MPISKRVPTRNFSKKITISIRIKGATSTIPILVGMILEILYVKGSTSIQIVLTIGLKGSGLTHERMERAKITQKYRSSKSFNT
jgi:hypothetical protein